MADVFSMAKRSQIMKKVVSHGNKSTELRLIQLLILREDYADFYEL